MGKDVILITGGTSDLGRSIIDEVMNDGAMLIVHYFRNEDKARELENKFPHRLVAVKADFREEQDIFLMINTIKEKGLTPNKILHLAASPIENKRFNELSWSDFNREIDIQLRSIQLILSAFFPYMAQAKKGKILFMLTSCTLNVPPAFLSNYIVAKYALLGLMKSLASEYASRGITVNAISPSMVETAFLKKINPKIIEMNAENSPLKRNAIPKDIAPLVRFLFSEESDYISGVNIPVTGGGVF
jgi:3-oxoacyl-[acyl-carrier protein] reductase